MRASEKNYGTNFDKEKICCEPMPGLAGFFHQGFLPWFLPGFYRPGKNDFYRWFLPPW